MDNSATIRISITLGFALFLNDSAVNQFLYFCVFQFLSNHSNYEETVIHYCLCPSLRLCLHGIFVGAHIDGYEQPMALMTKQAADSLKAASDELRDQSYRIKIWDSYRPQTAVNHFVRRAEGHSRGSTVDLTLVDEQTGKELDMGSPFDWFGDESHPDYMDLTEKQIANRHILWNAMFGHGFKGIDSEWWHFTLKDEPFPDTYFTFPVKQL